MEKKIITISRNKESDKATTIKNKKSGGLSPKEPPELHRIVAVIYIIIGIIKKHHVVSIIVLYIFLMTVIIGIDQNVNYNFPVSPPPPEYNVKSKVDEEPYIISEFIPPLIESSSSEESSSSQSSSSSESSSSQSSSSSESSLSQSSSSSESSSSQSGSSSESSSSQSGSSSESSSSQSASSSESSSSQSGSSSESSSSQSASSSESSVVPSGAGGNHRTTWIQSTPSSKSPGYTAQIAEYRKQNGDVKGWLRIPNTMINVPVLAEPTANNNYYGNKNWKKGYDVNGSVSASYGAKFGGRNEISKNLVLFGHADHASENGFSYLNSYKPNGNMFSQLHRYVDKDFAQKNPYIYVSTEKEDLVYQVFATFYTEPSLWYINPNPSSAQLGQIVASAKARSIWNFQGVQVGANDKIMLMSTCSTKYGYVHSGSSYFFNARWVVMAKLIENGKPYPVTVGKNPSPQAPQGLKLNSNFVDPPEMR